MSLGEDGSEAVVGGEDGEGVEEGVAEAAEDGVHGGVAADGGGEGGAHAHGARMVGEAAGDDGAVALASHGRVRPDGLRREFGFELGAGYTRILILSSPGAMNKLET